ncbi:MAG TPA: Gldg family protein [Acidobacteriota bacterium]|jgi:ABC-type uncharacterized transport system involved in gliding motility auxiliary subunit
MNRLLRYVPAAGVVLLLAGYFYYSIRSEWSIAAQVMVYGGGALLLFSLFWQWERIQKSFHRRAVRYGSAAGLVLLVLLGILGLINFLSFKHSKRYDLTENQLFSLSDQSRKITQNLKQDIYVTVFQKGKLPDSLRDLMLEYQAAGKRFHFTVVDPDQNPPKARELGVQRLGDIIVSAGSKKERIETATEESITNAIIKVTRGKNKIIYYVTGHGERDLNSTGADGFSVAKQKMDTQNYDLKPLVLAEEKKVPADASVVLVVGPKFQLLQPEVDALQSYLDQGGRLLLLVDPETNPGLDDFLKSKGLTLDNDVVVDASGIGQMFGIGPAAPLVTTYEGHAITQGFENTMTFFPLARSITTAASSDQGYSSQVLIKSNQRSWGETELKGGSAKFDAGKDKQGPLNMAVVATKRIDDKRQAKIVLFGDSDFAGNAYFQRPTPRNGDLFLNSVNWLAEDTELMAIRPHAPQSRSINMSLAQTNMLFYLTMILMPAAALIAGAAVWWNRRRA